MATVTKTTGDQAVDAALAAGFEITRHAPQPKAGTYFHELVHADGRMLVIDTALDTGRFVNAQGYSRACWNTSRLNARSLTALARLLAA